MARFNALLALMAVLLLIGSVGGKLVTFQMFMHAAF
jgi:hypothetical protein